MHLFKTAARIAGVVLLSFIAGLILSGINPVMGQGFDEKEEKDDVEEIRIGDIPPDFTFVDMDGNEFSLSGMAGEMPVVIDFWATWCPPCLAEIPVLVEFAEKYADEVVVVGVTSEAAENEQAIIDFAEENEISYRLIHDPSREIIDSYFVTGIPNLFVINIDGAVVATHRGYSPDMDLIGDLEEELGLESE